MKQIKSTIRFLILTLIAFEFGPLSFADQMNFRAGKLPQTYGRKVLFDISKANMTQMRQEDGYYSSWEVDSHPYDEVTFQMDGQENIYLLFKTAVRIFDKTGKLLNKIKLDPRNVDDGNGIFVDRNGDFCIYHEGETNTKPFIYLSSAGYENPIIVNKNGNNIRFLNGVLYSEGGGGVLYSFRNGNTPEQKLFFQTFFPKAINENKITPNMASKFFQQEIDGHQLSGSLTAIDLKNNVYIYGTKPVSVDGIDFKGRDVVVEDYRYFKFNSSLQLLASIPTGFSPFDQGWVDLVEESIFGVEKTNRTYRFLKWEMAK